MNLRHYLRFRQFGDPRQNTIKEVARFEPATIMQSGLDRASRNSGKWAVYSVEMSGVEHGQTQEMRCSRCGQMTPSYDIVNYGSVEGGYRQICNRCLNVEVASSDGLDDFEHVKFDPIRLIDCAGQDHDFHFRTRLFGTGVALDAFELQDGHPAGYQFQIIGDPEENLLALVGRLIEKMRRALSLKHVEEGASGMQIADHQVVRGMIEWDDAQDGRVPLLNVDGREITWDQFGRMLMTFEGWQFRLEIRDRSQEL